MSAILLAVSFSRWVLQSGRAIRSWCSRALHAGVAFLADLLKPETEVAISTLEVQDEVFEIFVIYSALVFSAGLILGFGWARWLSARGRAPLHGQVTQWAGQATPRRSQSPNPRFGHSPLVPLSERHLRRSASSPPSPEVRRTLEHSFPVGLTSGSAAPSAKGGRRPQ